jgi:hypothetical protein
VLLNRLPGSVDGESSDSSGHTVRSIAPAQTLPPSRIAIRGPVVCRVKVAKTDLPPAEVPFKTPAMLISTKAAAVRRWIGVTQRSNRADWNHCRTRTSVPPAPAL